MVAVPLSALREVAECVVGAEVGGFAQKLVDPFVVADTGAGTMKNNRTEPIELTGTHALSWRDYSRVQGPRGEFRALVVEVSGE